MLPAEQAGAGRGGAGWDAIDVDFHLRLNLDAMPDEGKSEMLVPDETGHFTLEGAL